MKFRFIIICFIFLFLIFITLLSQNIPFFWDTVLRIKWSNFYFDTNFKTLFLPAEIDNGDIPFYSFYIAIIWTVFGKTLFISHLAILPFIIGILHQFYHLTKRFILSEKLVWICLFLLLIEPTIITQFIFIGYDLFLLYFFLLSINSLLSKRYIVFSLALCGLAYSTLRGIFLLIPIFGLHIFLISYLKNLKYDLKSLATYFPVILLMITWFYYRYSFNGWYIFPPNIQSLQETICLHQLFRRFIFCVWKLCDFGRISLWLILIASVFFFYNKIDRKEIKFKILFLIFSFTTLINIIFITFINCPVNHRYFIVNYALLILFVVYFIQYFRKNIFKYIIIFLCAVFLITGNFWIYAEKFGNGWDSSLKVLPYFKLKNNFDSYIKSSQIKPSDIGAEFPMNSDKYDTYLSNEHFCFTDIDTKPFNDFKYIVQSNICNTFTPGEIEKLNTKWILVKEFRSWQVYIKLFKNPEHLNENKN